MVNTPLETDHKFSVIEQFRQHKMQQKKKFAYHFLFQIYWHFLTPLGQNSNPACEKKLFINSETIKHHYKVFETYI